MLQTLGQLAAGEDLSQEEMSAALDYVMLGRATEGEIALLLTGLRIKGETVEEVAGAASVLRKHMTPIRTRRSGLIDTCGTGGDRSRTFNISTAAALVTAAAGVPVAKHGNRRVTSLSGSADVLAELGVNIEAPVSRIETCLDELGICFCFAPLLHASMKHVAVVRQKLGMPTIFNMLGPLSNPAAAPFQLLGVGRAELRPLLAAVLARLGTDHSLVVHGEDGLDEVTLAGRTFVSEVRGNEVREFTWEPADFGLSESPLDSMCVEGPAESAAMIQRILKGERSPARDIVVVNAAAALWTARRAASPRECAELAAQAIDTLAAQKLLASLARASHQP